mmetsp:Transcript_25889/g.62163  ORF Transcript_25889/g.62163 Transcript_25889/m.62163 type:complete len:201 (-) Transcript_25889:427-1029(-)
MVREDQIPFPVTCPRQCLRPACLSTTSNLDTTTTYEWMTWTLKHNEGGAVADDDVEGTAVAGTWTEGLRSTISSSPEEGMASVVVNIRMTNTRPYQEDDLRLGVAGASRTSTMTSTSLRTTGNTLTWSPSTRRPTGRSNRLEACCLPTLVTEADGDRDDHGRSAPSKWTASRPGTPWRGVQKGPLVTGGRIRWTGQRWRL